MKNLLSAVALAAISAVAAPSVAQTAPSAIDSSAWSLHLGHYDDFTRLTGNYETAPLWQTRFGNGSRLTLSGEFGLSYWHKSGVDSGERDSLWQLSAIPLFRYWATERFYVEGGIGATAFNHTSIGSKQISTAFQFGDHIGLGYRVTNNVMLGYRYSHFSNAGIKKPNPGLDVHQITLTQRF